MKRILMFAGAGLGLLLIAALIIPFLIPTSVYKGQIEKAASEALGVEVTIDGNPRLSLLPNISASVDGVEVANPDGFSAPHFLKAGVLRARLQLWPLLSRQVIVDEITLSDLDLQIEGQADGTYNFMLLAENTAGQETTPTPSDPGEGFLTTVEKASMRNAAISISGPDLENPLYLTEFDGEARFTGLDQPIRTKGSGKLNGQQFSYDIDLETLDSVLANTSSQLKAALDTDFFNIDFDGTLVPNSAVPTASTVDGTFNLKSDTLAVIASMFGDALPPIAKLSDSLDARGSAKGSLDTVLALSFERLQFEASYGKVSYTGDLNIEGGERLSLDGAYDLLIEAPKDVINALELDLPIRAEALRKLEIKGSATGSAFNPNLQFETALIEADGLETRYSGGIDLTDLNNPQFNGNAKLVARQPEQLLQAPSPLAAPLALIGTLDATADVKGGLSDLTLSSADIDQKSDLLETQFTGQFSLADNTPLSGDLSLATDAPRALLARLGSPLPEGDTVQNFAVTSAISGTGQAPTLSGLTLTLDEMIATGSLTANLASAIPNLNANLTTDIIDLTPFLASEEETPSQASSLSADWSDDPLDLAALKLLNGQLTITANQIKMDKISLDDAQLIATLSNGRLSAAFDKDEEKPGFKAFDGEWSGDVVIDASRGTPRMSVKASADSIAAQRLLGDLTGYTGLTGLGDVQVDLSSRGTSLKALVSGLDGQFNSDLDEGVLSGINLAKLVRDAGSLQSLVRSGNLSVQSFRDAISTEAETDFSSFVGNLQFNQGVATITDLRLNNSVVAVIGTGSINLADRTIDIRLVPSFDANAQGQGSQLGLNSIPIPVRVSGPWTSLNYGLDTAAVQTELARQARARAGSEIGDRIGGDVGNIIGGLVGGSNSQPSQTTPESNETSNDTTEAEPQSVEDALVEGALGALFGRSRNSDTDDD